MVPKGCRVSTSFRVQEFAQLAGITVRALHHYDRLGLLKPRRNGSGYRLYCLRDLERLEQIVALKFLGIPLRQIQTLLDRDPLALPDALRSNAGCSRTSGGSSTAPFAPYRKPKSGLTLRY
jgi:DNA-binding transcriptional MerR regulator